jgi:hypothetical protein
VGIERIPSISPRTRWEPPLAPIAGERADGERDPGGAGYERGSGGKRRPRPAPPEEAPPPCDDDAAGEGGHHVDVRA